ncbi:UNVERIFIED_CONTAM: hypothetical protein PYX00_000258 [Menopon gallinae]|uniref:Uncharacterized protein n=1 Tax=Menopon gallinae TaxID=328185 RepID=A0AAW2I8E8_9NEOP
MRVLRYDIQVIRSIIICFGVYSANSAESPSATNPPEIVELFSGKHETHAVKNISLPAGVAHNENKIFTEGSTSSLNEPHQRIANITQGNTSQSHQVKMETASTTPKSKLPDESKSSVTPQKLNQTTLDFLYGVGDQTNGSSSVKPGKGVGYSKIVPKKGVDINDYLNYSLPSDHFCFYIRENTCYDIDNYKDIECTCCEVPNNLGIIISRQPLINCSICTPINIHSQPCNGICCKNISLPTSHVDKEKVNSNNSSKKSEVFENSSTVNPLNKSNHTKKLKLKPTVTNVPYDSGPSNPFSKSRGEKYVPIIVSIFILPLVGVFIFFIWKKTREIWDRRYYKRMDFLIDGMYNE